MFNMWLIVFEMITIVTLKETFYAKADDSLNCSQANTAAVRSNFVKLCPENWPLSQVEQKCNNNLSSNESLLSIWPVTDTNENVTFSNVFCAACHNKLNSSVFWKVRIECVKSYNETVNDERFTYLTSNDQSKYDTNGENSSNVNNSCYNSKSFNYTEWIEPLASGHCLLWFVPVDSQKDRFQKAIHHSFQNLTSNNYDERVCSHQETSVIKIEQLITDNSVNRTANDTWVCSPRNASIEFNGGEVKWNSWSGCNRAEVLDPSQNVCVSLGGDISSPILSECNIFIMDSTYYELGSNGTLFLKGLEYVLTTEEYIDAGNGEYIICDPWEQISPDYYNYITLICTSIAEIALALKIIFFLLFPRQRLYLPGWIVLCLCVTLFTAQFLHLVGIRKTYVSWLCTTVAILMHFFFLSYFFWMNILCFDLWRTFSSLKIQSTIIRKKNIFVRYCVYGWGAPAIIIICTCLLDYVFPPTSVRPIYGEIFCWLNNPLATQIFFVAPLLIVLVINVVLFGKTVIAIGRDAYRSRKFQISSDQEMRNLILLLLKLTLVTGFTWWFAFLALLFPLNRIVECIFLFANAFQGVYIFFTFFPSKKDFKRLIQSCGYCLETHTTNSPDTSTTYSENKV